MESAEILKGYKKKLKQAQGVPRGYKQKIWWVNVTLGGIMSVCPKCGKRVKRKNRRFRRGVPVHIVCPPKNGVTKENHRI